MNTRNILFFVAICFGSILAGCSNDDWHFDDFDYTTTYFPWQFPVRTLELGEVDYDNSNDLNHCFVISARMGGVYENKMNHIITFKVDETLCNNLFEKTSGKQLKVLPKEYYFLENENTITIPKGSFSGGIKVQLKDAFFNDPEALDVNYVLPMRILTSTTDSVLSGAPLVENADCRDATQWKTQPKDFTIFAVKYINKYHGKYLLRGKTICKNTSNEEQSRVVYHQQYVEKDIVTPMLSASLTQVDWESQVRVAAGTSPGSFKARISVDDNGKCTVTSAPNSAFKVSGNGEWVNKGDSWGGRQRNVFHLNYSVETGENIYEMTDTLVFRDNANSVQEFTPSI